MPPWHPSKDESAHASPPSNSGAPGLSLFSPSPFGPPNAPSLRRPKETEDISHAWWRSLLSAAPAHHFLLFPFLLFVAVTGAVFLMDVRGKGFVVAY